VHHHHHSAQPAERVLEPDVDDPERPVRPS